MSQYIALIGIDWGDKQHEVLLRETKSNCEQRLKLQQDPKAIDKWMSELRKCYPEGKIAISVEQKRGALVYALLKYDFIDIYSVNPKSSARYREVFYPSGAKDDQVDAKLLLDMLLKHRKQLDLLKPDDQLTSKIRLLVEKRRAFVDQRKQLTNRLTILLKEYFPQVLDMFEDLNNLLVCEFLIKWSTLEKVKKCKPITLKKFFHKHNSRCEKIIQKRIELVRNAIPLTTDKAIIETSALTARCLCEQIKVVIATIKTFDKEIDIAVKEHKDLEIFKSLPGAANLTAGRMIAALGTDRNKFKNANELASYVGIAPVLRRTGNGNTETVHSRWACNKFLRQTFHEYAGQSIIKSYWAKHYYNQQLKRTRRSQMAKRALAYKWIRIIYHCWKKGVLYDEATYLKALEKKGSSLLQLNNGDTAIALT